MISPLGGHQGTMQGENQRQIQHCGDFASSFPTLAELVINL